MKKRALSILLALCLMLSLVPVLSGTAEAAGTSSISDQILNLNTTKPSNYDSLAATDPYNKGTGNQFLLNERNRLMLYQTENDNYYVERTIKNNFTLSDDPDSNHNIDYQPMSVMRTDDMVNKTNLSDTTKTMAFVSSVSYSPTDSGNRDHAAFVGIDAADQRLKVWVQNTSTGATSAAVTLGDEAVSWNKSITQYNYHAFLTLTAGNYDGDASGKETFIVYFPGTTDADPELFEFSLSESGNSLTLTQKSSISLTALLYTGVTGQDIMDGTHFQIPTISLATGDFDGDGRQELAVASGSYKKADTTSISNMECYTTKLSVLKFSGRNASSNLKYTIPYSTYLYDTIAQTKDSSDTLTSEQYRLLYAGSVAAGDVNGDGQDEIIVSGYTGTAKNNFNASGDVTNTSNVYVRSGSDLCIATVSYSAAKASYSRTAVGTVSMNKFTTGHIANDKDSWPMMATTCVKINGDAAADCFFLSGTLYEWEDGSPAPVFTPYYFTKSYNSANGNDLQMTWVDAAVAGSFDGNAAGRQQLVLTVGIKFSAVGSMGDAEYAYKLGLIAGTGYSDTYESDNTIKSYGSATAYCSSDIQADGAFADGSKGNNFGSSSAANTSKVLNFVPVVTDSGKSIKAKLNSTNWVYTDPQVEAVLQAAPYFGELNDYSEFVNPGQTTYSVTTSYTFGKTSENNVSFGVGFAGEGKVNLGAAVKISAEAGYTLDWSHTYDRSLTTSYTNTFTSGEYDTVILQRTPMVVYSYNIYDEDGKWVDDAYQISVPLEPTFYQMTVDEYNQFVDDFAAWYKSNYPSSNDSSVLLSKITSEMLPENSDGDPTAYRTSWDPASMQIGTSNVSDNAVSLSKGTKTIGYGGATATSEWTQESSYNEGVTMNHGFHTSLTVQGGVGAVGNEGLVGGYVSLDYNHGTGSYKTNTKENGASGTVADINSKALLKDKGIPESVSREYGFTWSFGKWDVDLGGVRLKCSLTDQNNKPLYNNQVQFFGYAVSNIRRPAAAVATLKAELTSDNTASLTWTAPTNTGRPDITGYNVYELGSDGKYTLLNQTPLSNDAVSYTDDQLSKSNTDYSFVITALSDAGESIWSNVATVTTPKQYYTLKLTGNVSASAGYEGVSVKSGGQCPEDTIVYVSAKVLDGYALTGYQIGNGTPMTFAPCESKSFNFRFPSADTTVTFITTQVQSDITFAPNDPTKGSVTATVGGTPLDSGGGIVTNVVTVTATPKAGNVLTGWTITEKDSNGATTGTAETISDDGSGILTLNPVKPGYSITANFESTSSNAGQKTVTITAPQFGSIKVTDSAGTVLKPNASGEIKVVLNSILTFEAVPAELYSFKSWTGDLSGTANSQIVKISVDMTIGADFSAPVMYKITYAANPIEGGAVSAANGNTSIQTGAYAANGSALSFKAAPKANYIFNGWTINGSSNSAASDNLSMTITKTTNVTAAFIRTYSITATAGAGGTITPSGVTTVKSGDGLTYHIAADYGYEITDVVIDSVSQGKLSSFNFANITADHAISATFKSTGAAGGSTGGSTSSYTLTFDTNGGSAVAVISRSSGTSVDLSAYLPTREGYSFGGWYADAGLTQPVSSVTLAADTTVYAKWNWINPFTDVKEGDYFYDAVRWASGSGITDGMSKTTFEPDGICTRAQAVAFLWRAAGSPAPKATAMPFNDVPADSYYYNAVLWAVEQGITKGTSDTAFSPDMKCSRAHVVTFLWRAKGAAAMTADNPFADVSAGDYFYNAVLWAVANKITDGTGTGAFSPNNDCTRGQIVTFIYRGTKQL